jgi:hypothetical protein
VPDGRVNNGRPLGSRNKRTEAIWAKLEARGDLDPVEYLSSLVANEKTPPDQRIAAAIALAPYRHSKRGLEPQPVPLVYVTTPVELPHPHVTSIPEVVANIEYLSGLRRDGKLDLAAADALISDMRLVRDALVEAAKLEVAQGGPPNQVIEIKGGLPPLRLGPEDGPILMPELNGHAGPAIDGLPGPAPGQKPAAHSPNASAAPAAPDPKPTS